MNKPRSVNKYSISWIVSGVSGKIVIGTAVVALFILICNYFMTPSNCHTSGPKVWTAADGSRNFAIKTTWNGQCIKHEPMKVSLSPAEDGGCIMKVSGPFFNSPAAPQGPPGPFDKLWDYEVVEAFFLNDKDQYLEVELGPHGHHLLLMLNGQRNAVETKLPLTYTAEIYGDQWEGKASIPLSYFPPGVTKFNAYAIHGEGDNRVYESLYPAKNTPAPDFHRLEFFEPLDMTKIVYNYNPDETSEKWKPYEKS